EKPATDAILHAMRAVLLVGRGARVVHRIERVELVACRGAERRVAVRGVAEFDEQLREDARQPRRVCTNVDQPGADLGAARIDQQDALWVLERRSLAAVLVQRTISIARDV